MTKSEANGILDAIRDGYPVSIFVTNQALERTGDLCRPFSQSLRFDGDEQSHDRPCEIPSQGTEVGFSYSRYLDSQQNKGVKE